MKKFLCLSAIVMVCSVVQDSFATSNRSSSRFEFFTQQRLLDLNQMNSVSLHQRIWKREHSAILGIFNDELKKFEQSRGSIVSGAASHVKEFANFGTRVLGFGQVFKNNLSEICAQCHEAYTKNDFAALMKLSNRNSDGKLIGSGENKHIIPLLLSYRLRPDQLKKDLRSALVDCLYDYTDNALDRVDVIVRCKNECPNELEHEFCIAYSEWLYKDFLQISLIDAETIDIFGLNVFSKEEYAWEKALSKVFKAVAHSSDIHKWMIFGFFSCFNNRLETLSNSFDFIQAQNYQDYLNSMFVDTKKHKYIKNASKILRLLQAIETKRLCKDFIENSRELSVDNSFKAFLSSKHLSVIGILTSGDQRLQPIFYGEFYTKHPELFKRDYWSLKNANVAEALINNEPFEKYYPLLSDELKSIKFSVDSQKKDIDFFSSLLDSILLNGVTIDFDSFEVDGLTEDSISKRDFQRLQALLSKAKQNAELTDMFRDVYDLKRAKSTAVVLAYSPSKREQALVSYSTDEILGGLVQAGRMMAEKIYDQDREIAQLKRDNNDLHSRLESLDQKVDGIEQVTHAIVATMVRHHKFGSITYTGYLNDNVFHSLNEYGEESTDSISKFIIDNGGWHVTCRFINGFIDLGSYISVESGISSLKFEYTPKFPEILTNLPREFNCQEISKVNYEGTKYVEIFSKNNHALYISADGSISIGLTNGMDSYLNGPCGVFAGKDIVYSGYFQHGAHYRGHRITFDNQIQAKEENGVWDRHNNFTGQRITNGLATDIRNNSSVGPFSGIYTDIFGKNHKYKDGKEVFPVSSVSMTPVASGTSNPRVEEIE